MEQASHNTLIIYVPGYSEQGPDVKLRGYVRWAIQNTKAADGTGWRPPPKPEERAFAGYSGLRYTVAEAVGPRLVDIVEVPWQTEITKLTSRPPAVRLPRGISLLWINFLSGLRTSSSRGYALATGIGLLLLTLWLLLLIMSIAGGVESARNGAGLKGPLLWIPEPVKVAWHLLQPKGWLYFILLAIVGALALVRIDPGAIADIADLYDRFTHKRTDPGSYITAHATLVGLVRDAVAAVNDGSYGRVVVLGHSFGALIACTAVAEERLAVELVTVGTYFSYLDNLDRRNIEALFKQVLNAPIVRWVDFYSRNDWFASSRGYSRVKDKRYDPQHADLKPGLTLWEKFTGVTHRYYFEDPKVLAMLFESPASAAVRA